MATIAKDRLPDQISPPIEDAVGKGLLQNQTFWRDVLQHQPPTGSSCSLVGCFLQSDILCSMGLFSCAHIPMDILFNPEEGSGLEKEGTLREISFFSCLSPVSYLLSGNNIKCNLIVFLALILALWCLANELQSSSVLCNWTVILKYHSF